MTDEVNLDNLDALADLPDSADTAVEADPVADAAVDSINDNAEEQPVAADGAVESGTAENDAEASGDADEQESEELDAGAKAVEEFSKSLRTLEGKWYVLHTYSGYEKRVKTNVESRVVSFGLEDKIFQIEVPMEEVDKHTDKGKKVITRVRVPGYVLIRMWPDEDARRIVRETEGVTGFVGPTKDPAPLSRKEVVAMLAPMIASEALKKAGDKPAAAKKRVVEVSYAVGDQVTVIDGPFATMSNPPRRSSPCWFPSSGATRRWNSASIRWRSFSKSSDVVCMNGGRFPAAVLRCRHHLCHDMPRTYNGSHGIQRKTVTAFRGQAAVQCTSEQARQGAHARRSDARPADRPGSHDQRGRNRRAEPQGHLTAAQGRRCRVPRKLQDVRLGA